MKKPGFDERNTNVEEIPSGDGQSAPLNEKDMMYQSEFRPKMWMWKDSISKKIRSIFLKGVEIFGKIHKCPEFLKVLKNNHR